MNKVSVIGAGNVGATAVYYIAEKNIADIIDRDNPDSIVRKMHEFVIFYLTTVGKPDFIECDAEPVG